MLRPNAGLCRGAIPRPTLDELATDMIDDEDDVEPKLRRGRFRSLLSSTSSLSVSSISTSVSFMSPRRDDAEAAAERAAVRRLDERGWDSVVDAAVIAGIAEVVLDRRRLILVTPPVSDIVGGKDGTDADATMTMRQRLLHQYLWTQSPWNRQLRHQPNSRPRWLAARFPFLSIRSVAVWTDKSRTVTMSA